MSMRGSRPSLPESRFQYGRSRAGLVRAGLPDVQGVGAVERVLDETDVRADHLRVAVQEVADLRGQLRAGARVLRERRERAADAHGVAHVGIMKVKAPTPMARTGRSRTRSFARSERSRRCGMPWVFGRWVRSWRSGCGHAVGGGAGRRPSSGAARKLA
jgi:hypothetical protein